MGLVPEVEHPSSFSPPLSLTPLHSWLLLTQRVFIQEEKQASQPWTESGQGVLGPHNSAEAFVIWEFTQYEEPSFPALSLHGIGHLPGHLTS